MSYEGKMLPSIRCLFRSVASVAFNGCVTMGGWNQFRWKATKIAAFSCLSHGTEFVVCSKLIEHPNDLYLVL